ncbi:MAG: C25 family cysteine peptidase [candidate division WOR-3 bacterium]
MRTIGLLLIPVLAAAGLVSVDIEFRPEQFVFDKANGFDVVALPGEYWTSVPGEPLLPIATYNVAIPPDAEVVSVEVKDAVWEPVPGEFYIHPCQRPQVLSQPKQEFVGPDDKAYRAGRPYPAAAAGFTRTGCLSGYRIAGVQVAPLRYFPVEKRLELATRMRVEVRYETGGHEVLALDESQVRLMGEYARTLVVNPNDIARWQPATKTTDDWLCDMAVITTGGLASAFQPFADWKTKRGIKTVIIRTDSVYSTYPGRDNQEKIRNCVIDYWKNHGLKWLLVGGDAEVVPVRLARIVCEGNTGDIATDFYYADLQGSWDSNRNNLFGEMTDSMDLFHDIFVGRTPVDNASDVAVFFAKDTMFERYQDTTCLRKLLLGSTMLFSPFHGRVINRMIAELFPTSWQFAHLEDPASGVYRNAMNQGYQLAHVAAHGSPTTFSVMSSSEVPSLTNGFTKLNFVNSIACESGWFDGQECLAEALVKAANGGCVACCLNSRYGFGYPPAFGPSEMLDLQFYRHLTNADASQFGTLNALSKDHFQTLTMGQEVWRWCVYELNLFGDPTLAIFTQVPRNLAVTCADSALVGPQVFRVGVRNGLAPVKGALVCLRKGAETYARGATNSQGWVDLFVAPATTGAMALSVSAQNYFPYEMLIPVRGTSNRPALVFAGCRIADGNGRLDPGETVDLFVSVANLGATAATAVTATLRTSSPYLTLTDSTATYGTIAAGDTVEGDAFRVSASSATPLGTLAELLAACSANEGFWEPFFELRVGEATGARGLWLDHDTGNVILSVTCVGSVGTLGPYREGSGMKYPRDAGYGSLYFTSLACGNGPSYVVDRWYGNPSTTYNTDWQIAETLTAVRPPFAADEEYRASFTDAAHTTPKGLRVSQWSGALASSGYRDFVIIEYVLDNQGASAINGLYCGIFSDFDVNNTTSNRVVSDTIRRLTYMMQSSSADPSVGVKLLSPTVAANQSAIDHAVYVQPSGMMTEAVKDSFLRGAIRMPNSNRSANWSCVVSAGPFNLGPGQRQKVAFAFVGGTSEAEIRVRADSAQSWYDKKMPRGVTYLKHTVDDAPPGGNGDGIINPGETVNLPLWVLNRTDGPARGIRGILRKTSADTLVMVLDSLRYFGTVQAGDSAWTGPSGYRFRVSEACTNRYQLPVVLVCRDTFDSNYISPLPLAVGAAQLVPAGVRCWDPRPGGNNNRKLDPGEEADIALGLQNIGLGSAENVSARLRSLDARLVVLDSLGTYGLVRPDSTVFNSADRFHVSAQGSIPRESQIPCSLFVFGTNYAARRLVHLGVGELISTDPIPDGPRTPSRYYAYDDCDTLYVSRPDYQWVEISAVGTRINFSHNDAVVVVNLPTGFGPLRYYGQRYTQISVSADGWIVPGNYTTTNYTNTTLPSSSAPPGAICGNWDDLYPGYSSQGYVYYYHDAANHRFVVEFDSVKYYDSSVRDKFEFVFYDTTRSGPTGDNSFDVQYMTANEYTSSTVGLQDQTRAIGIQCLFDGSYHKAASQIVPGRAIRYTTDSVQTGIREQGVGGKTDRLELSAGPNPMHRQSVISVVLPKPGQVRLAVCDIAGRVVKTLADTRLDRGQYSFVWDCRNDAGKPVAAGVYLVRLATDSGILTRKTLLVR